MLIAVSQRSRPIPIGASVNTAVAVVVLLIVPVGVVVKPIAMLLLLLLRMVMWRHLLLMLLVMDVAVTSDASLVPLLWMVVMTVGDAVVVVFVLLEELSSNRSDRVLIFFGIVARPQDLLLLYAVSRAITVHVVIVVVETVANAVGR